MQRWAKHSKVPLSHPPHITRLQRWPSWVKFSKDSALVCLMKRMSSCLLAEPPSVSEKTQHLMEFNLACWFIFKTNFYSYSFSKKKVIKPAADSWLCELSFARTRSFSFPDPNKKAMLISGVGHVCHHDIIHSYTNKSRETSNSWRRLSSRQQKLTWRERSACSVMLGCRITNQVANVSSRFLFDNDDMRGYYWCSIMKTHKTNIWYLSKM